MFWSVTSSPIQTRLLRSDFPTLQTPQACPDVKELAKSLHQRLTRQLKVRSFPGTCSVSSDCQLLPGHFL